MKINELWSIQGHPTNVGRHFKKAIVLADDGARYEMYEPRARRIVRLVNADIRRRQKKEKP